MNKSPQGIVISPNDPRLLAWASYGVRFVAGLFVLESVLSVIEVLHQTFLHGIGSLRLLPILFAFIIIPPFLRVALHPHPLSQWRSLFLLIRQRTWLLRIIPVKQKGETSDHYIFRSALRIGLACLILIALTLFFFVIPLITLFFNGKCDYVRDNGTSRYSCTQ